MLKRINLRDVEIGMFIHKMEGSWFDHPFWKSRFLLKDRDILRELQASTIDGVIIDTSKGKDLHFNRNAAVTGTAPASIHRPTLVRANPRPAFPAQRREQRSALNSPQAGNLNSTMPQSMAREFGNAQQVARHSQKVISKLFLEARLGKIVKLRDVEPIIEQIYTTVQRNSHAFSGLMRCKQNNEFVYRHALSVSALMVSLARQMKFTAQDIREAGLAGLMLDIGISNLSADLAAVSGDFRALEPEIFNRHAVFGHELLEAAGDIPEKVLQVCLAHHERLDGSGYPQGLHAQNIDQLSRMAAICDTFDILVADGGAKTGLDPAAALRHLGERDTEFDQDILHHFIEAVGIYPIGSFVRLRSDRLAMVVDENPDSLSHPVVRTFYSLTLGMRLRGETIDLANCYGEDEIIGIADLNGLVLPELSQLRDLIFIAACKIAR